MKSKNNSRDLFVHSHFINEHRKQILITLKMTYNAYKVYGQDKDLIKKMEKDIRELEEKLSES